MLRFSNQVYPLFNMLELIVLRSLTSLDESFHPIPYPQTPNLL